MAGRDSNPGNANLPIGGRRNAIQENGVPGKIWLVSRPLWSWNISFWLEGGQGMHGNAGIPNRPLRILFDFGRVEAAHTSPVRARMFPPHDVWERFREVGVFLRLLIKPGQDAVTPEGHPDVVVRIGIALISAEVRVRILVFSDLSVFIVEHTQRLPDGFGELILPFGILGKTAGAGRLSGRSVHRPFVSLWVVA